MSTFKRTAVVVCKRSSCGITGRELWSYFFFSLSAPTSCTASHSAYTLSYMHTEGVVWLCSYFPNRWRMASSYHSALINFNSFLVLWRTREISTSSGHSLTGLLPHSVHAEYCPNLHAVGSHVSPVCCPLYRPNFSLTVPHSHAQNRFYSSDVAER